MQAKEFGDEGSSWLHLTSKHTESIRWMHGWPMGVKASSVEG